MYGVCCLLECESERGSVLICVCVGTLMQMLLVTGCDGAANKVVG